MVDLWALRDWFLAPSQFHGYEWVVLFLGIAYLWAVLRTGVLDGVPLGPVGVTRADVSVAVLTLAVLLCVAANPVTM